LAIHPAERIATEILWALNLLVRANESFQGFPLRRRRLMLQTKVAQEPRVLAADTLTGDKVVNLQMEDVGEIEHLMIDLETGRIAYAVLSFGGFLGMGDKLFAIPWSSLALDTIEKRFILNVDKELLKSAPGFDKDHWPNMADHTWGTKVFTYYGAKPYWN
jgi:hypothetical protein